LTSKAIHYYYYYYYYYHHHHHHLKCIPPHGGTQGDDVNTFLLKELKNINPLINPPGYLLPLSWLFISSSYF